MNPTVNCNYAVEDPRLTTIKEEYERRGGLLISQQCAVGIISGESTDETVLGFRVVSQKSVRSQSNHFFSLVKKSIIFIVPNVHLTSSRWTNGGVQMWLVPRFYDSPSLGRSSPNSFYLLKCIEDLLGDCWFGEKSIKYDC